MWIVASFMGSKKLAFEQIYLKRWDLQISKCNKGFDCKAETEPFESKFSILILSSVLTYLFRYITFPFLFASTIFILSGILILTSNLLHKHQRRFSGTTPVIALFPQIYNSQNYLYILSVSTINMLLDFKFLIIQVFWKLFQNLIINFNLK